MSRIASVFQSGRKALIAYITVGYPDIEATEKIAAVLVKSGCDLIELGIPFSDPLADGATIQKTSFQALQQGVTPETCLEVASRLSAKIAAPLVFMTYYNPVFNFGLEAFCGRCAGSGISGLIIPDLPPEEASELEDVTRQYGLDLIYLLAPTSPDGRIAVVAARSRGFIYLTSLTGVTGARQSLPPDLEEFIARVRQQAKQPLCVGFGVSNPEQAGRIAGIADGVIVGSRLLELVEEDPSLSLLKDFTLSLRKAMDLSE
ncbi:MAG: tryptophan synthase subunit alpha [Chloroflexi bacterium]|nr:tryptophan synthase subunit alpha [Chloroflexota bacterium]